MSPAFMFFYIMVWLNLAIYIINKLALAMVEDGYLNQRNRQEKDWLTKNITDPGLKTRFDKIKANSLTMPDALKSFNKARWLN